MLLNICLFISTWPIYADTIMSYSIKVRNEIVNVTQNFLLESIGLCCNERHTCYFFLWTNSIRPRHVMTSSDLVRLLIDFHLSPSTRLPFSSPSILPPPSHLLSNPFPLRSSHFFCLCSLSSSLSSLTPPSTANSFLFLFALSLFLILHNISLFKTGTGTERKEMSQSDTNQREGLLPMHATRRY